MKKAKGRKLLSLFLTFLLVFGLSIGAFAATPATTDKPVIGISRKPGAKGSTRPATSLTTP